MSEPTTIELVISQHSTIEWGKMFYPAHEADHAVFLHCTDVGIDYLMRGGVMAQKYVDICHDIFRMHGYEPVIIDKANATWQHPILERTPPEQNNGTPVPPNNN